MPHPNQPLLHELVALCAAPTQALSWPDGRMSARADGRGTAHGVMHADVRILSEWRLEVAGEAPSHLATELTSERDARFTYLTPGLPGGNADRFLRLDVGRRVDPGAVSEVLRFSSQLAEPVKFDVRLELASDMAPMQAIKMGRPAEPIPFPANGDLGFGNAEVGARLHAPGADVRRGADDACLEVVWPLTISPGETVEVEWRLDVEDAGAIIVAASGDGLDEAAISERLAGDAATDPRLAPWLRQSLLDLNGLRVATKQDPDDPFFAAGAPWYFTLFGRDSIWTSRLLLPADVSQAGGTLRTLARLAGTTVDVETAEQPGKIPHELRRGTYSFGGTSLPPLYYGTVDATPLWICLLHDAWRAGLGDDQVLPLLPTLERALAWLTTYGDADGDGFLEYLDVSGHGLANQGWKDSRDSIRFADGRVAEGPIALCEVQGYAHQAAVGGAALLDAFGRDGADAYRSWAARLSDRFRDQFWCGEDESRYPAIALDGEKRRVDSVTSNIGHLLGTGLLNAEEEGIVARRVAADDLDSGLGLRTMSSEAGGYSPLSYHCGSVWPHDTAIVIAGLLRAGHGDLAGGLVEGLLRASYAFDGRLPELWSGEGRPVPYPAACRPQAWSAASAVSVAEWLRQR